MDIDQQKFIIGGLVALLVLIGGILYLADSNESQNASAPLANVGSGATASTIPPTTKTMKATIKTQKGDIALELYPDAAPKTVENFIAKAKSGYFDGLKFHRVEDWVIQGGDPLSRDESQKERWGTGGGDIETELSARPFVEGALGVARGPDIKVSNDSQFFIVKKDSQFLNDQYTLFGQVTAGMDVVNKITRGDTIRAVTVE